MSKGGGSISDTFSRVQITQSTRSAQHSKEGKYPGSVGPRPLLFPFGRRRRRRSLCIFVVVSTFPTLDRPKPAHCSSFLK